MFKKIVSILLNLIFIMTLCHVCVSADAVKNGVSASFGNITNSIVAEDYENYSTSFEFQGFSNKTDIILSGDKYSESTGSEIYENNALSIKMGQGSVKYLFDITETGVYKLYVNYALPSSENKSVEFSCYVDGEFPFNEAESFCLPRLWQDSADGKRIDSFGNEYSAEQVVYTEFCDTVIFNPNDVRCSEYLFYLEAGIHTLNLFSFSDNVIISKIGFKSQVGVPTYSQVREGYIKNSYKELSGEPIMCEGENAKIKSERSLVSKSDSASPSITPSDPIIQKMNYIGGTNWKNIGEEIVWEIKVSQSGLYKLGFVFKQDQNINSISYRSLKIDGEIPFEECSSIKFVYGTDWQSGIIGDIEDYLFYLEEGVHKLSLTATLGDTAPYYDALNKIVGNIGDMYLDITMITGESPDANRDYELFNNIPEYNSRLENIHSELSDVADGLLELSNGEVTSFISSIRDMMRVSKSMVENKYEAHKYLSNYSTCYTTLCNWLYDMRSMPVGIDKFYVIPSKEDFEFETVSFGNKLLFGFKRFLAAFGDDYNNLSNVDESEKHLKIWVNWGRDQATVLNSLIAESFTPKTGINVNLEITNASLLYGILSNNAPDLALHMARTEPVNLAMRGALVDLTQFSDYKEVVSRFGESASIPYEYGNGVYALPDTQSFYIMFYRKDILKELGIPVPETWQEFLDAVSVLQRNNMNAWIPYTQITATNTVNTGVGGLNLYASVLQQFGGNFYNNELNKCTIDNEVGLKAFSYWTDMYTKYTLPTSASFYNRFRMGTMPLGVDTYTLYTTLNEAAPDIAGRWGIALVPGIKDENGAINHTVSGSGTGCTIINASKNKEGAWEFLKWWTDADTQLDYNNNVEAILGTISRTTTANLETFERMDWQKSDLDILLEQRSWIKEIPEVPGSYYVSRSVDQAFWNVVNNGARPKDVVDKWGEIATAEIVRKIAEYSK